MPDEPTENVGEGAASAFPTDEPETRAEAVVDALGERYWQKVYGGQDAFECLVRTILSQNTSDEASQPAHDALVDRYGDGDLAQALADADQSTLAETIRPAGLYNQKSAVLTAVAAGIVEAFGGATEFDSFVTEERPETVRQRLLDLHGVGPKTADCVLLFAGGNEGVFPVDTHVHRIARRTGLASPDADHETVRAHLERDVPASKCGFGHTAMIQFGRDYCTARNPACLDGPGACPLSHLCDRVGVDIDTGEVRDPAETVSQSG